MGSGTWLGDSVLVSRACSLGLTWTMFRVLRDAAKRMDAPVKHFRSQFFILHSVKKNHLFITVEGQQNLDLYSVLRAFEQRGMIYRVTPAVIRDLCFFPSLL